MKRNSASKSLLLSATLIGMSSATVVPIITSCKSVMSCEVYGLSYRDFGDMVVIADGPHQLLANRSQTNLSGSFSKSVTDHDMLHAMSKAMNIYSYAYPAWVCLFRVTQGIMNSHPGIEFSNFGITVEVKNRQLTTNTRASFDGLLDSSVLHFVLTVNGNQSLCAAGGGSKGRDDKIFFGQYGNEYKTAHNFHLVSTGLTQDYDIWYSAAESSIYSDEWGSLLNVVFPLVTTWPIFS